MTAPLRIAHVVGTFPPYHGGTGNVAWNESRELAARGHVVRVFTAAGERSPFPPVGVTAHALRPLVRAGNANVIPALLRSLGGFDVVHMHYPFFSAELVWAAARRSGARLVVTYHHDVQLAGIRGLLAASYQRLIGARVLRAADRVLFTTREYASQSSVATLLPPSRVGYHSPGVDERRFNPIVDGTGVRTALGVSSREVMLLFVGGLDRAHYFKGVSTLLGAMQRINDPSIQLVIVGNGNMRTSYQHEASQRGLADRVIFSGNVSEHALPAYYAAADLLVLPSTTAGEAFGLVVLEALATGTPVIASDLPGVRFLVDYTHGGRLVAPGDPAELARAIATVVKDAAARQRYADAGRRAVETAFTWRLVGQRLEQVYFDVLRNAREFPSQVA